jgi:hypothetical protein
VAEFLAEVACLDPLQSGICVVTPHDDLFHFVFQHPHHAVAWLVSALLRPIGEAIDWSTLQLASEKLRDDNLRWPGADLVLAAERRGWGGSRLDPRRAQGELIVEVAPVDLHTTFERLLQRREETIMSTAERLRREGMEVGLAKGLTQGLTQGRTEALLRLLTRRFGEVSPATVARIRGASMPELDRWTDRILDARTLGEVFAD